MKIKKLDKVLINKIAAGEVVEGPQSVVKELIENAIDAHADSIIIEIGNGGLELIRVVDNGEGMTKEDLKLAFERYATSKISDVKDLENIHSLGFRGEALPSIASVSEIEVYSRQKGEKNGYFLHIKEGKIIDEHPRGGPIGTNIAVKNLFYNVPARKKFLKSPQQEYRNIYDFLEGFFLSYPQIAFKVIKDKKEVLFIEKSHIKERYLALFKDAKSEDFIEVQYESDFIKIEGLISKINAYKKNKKRIFITVNGRIIKDPLLTYYFIAPYQVFLMKGQFPQGFLNIVMDSHYLDVNVHPRKTEVKFLSPSKVRNAIFNAIYEELKNYKEPQLEKENIQIEHVDFEVKKEYKQGEFQFTHGAKKEFEQTLPIARETYHGIITINGKDYQYIDTFFNTYILLKSKKEILLIDQHAADERVLYEKIKKSYESGKMLSQELLFPVRIDVNLEQHHIEFLERIGFKINKKRMVFEAFPNWLNLRKEKEEVETIIEEVFEEKQDFMDWIKQLSCKSAVKGGQKLPFPLIKEIVTSLFQCEDPYRCPHGRPTVLRYTEKDLEKMFHRIG